MRKPSALQGKAMNAYADTPARTDVAEINIIPLADVLLVLLIIFMVTAPVASKTIGLDLPQATPNKVDRPVRDIALRINAAGEVYWNDSLTPLSALDNMLQAEAQRDPAKQPLLRIAPNDDADYGTVTKVLAAARNADMRRIAFVAD